MIFDQTYLFFMTLLWIAVRNVSLSPDSLLCFSNLTIVPCDDLLNKWVFDLIKQQCQFYEFGCITADESDVIGSSDLYKTQMECEISCRSEQERLKLRLKQSQKQKQLQPDNRIEYAMVNTGSDPELVLHEHDSHKTFMFAQSNAFIQLDAETEPILHKCRLCRQISFEFRTRLPHGLLVYHNVKVPDNRIELESYALYIIVQQGRLKVVHVFGKHSTELSVGQGLNRDRWHSVSVRIDVHAARIMIRVDNVTEEIHLKGLHAQRNYGVTSNLKSIVQIGGIDKGLSSEEKLHGVKYIIESFLGCIRNVTLSAGKSASDLLSISPLVANKYQNIEVGCRDRCDDIYENLCFKNSKCINHYDRVSCDCFGTNYESEHCDVYAATVLTLRGSSYVSYRIYDWKDRVHSANIRISLFFKTKFNKSVLFYASGGDQGINHFIAVSIFNNSVHIEIKCGNDLIKSNLGDNVVDNRWHNLTIYHDERVVWLMLDKDDWKLFDFATDDEVDDISYFYIDPEIYIGGGPELNKKFGLLAFNNFVGNLKYVFFNDISILFELKMGNPKVHYIGMLGMEFVEKDVNTIPVTFPFASSHIWWPNFQKTQLNLRFIFKSNRSIGVLASSDLIKRNSSNKIGFWELRVIDDEIRAEFVSEIFKNFTHLVSVKHYNLNDWNMVKFSYSNSTLQLKIGNDIKETKLFVTDFELGDKIIIGSGFKINTGFVGCMKEIFINSERLDPRIVIQTERLIGEVSLDNCQFIDACKRPNTCEHGGKCSIKEDKLKCNCKGTGYIGKNCHFAKFRKTCEELALLGHTKPDVYLIDIDGNGKFPPAHVRCEFQTYENATKTIVEHNLPSQVDVRSYKSKDFSFKIKYREFSADMLQELIQHSLNCSQYVRYDCFKAPIHLYSATRFISSASQTIDYLGEVKRGSCPCAEHENCDEISKRCHCDANEPKWSSDEGYFTEKVSLGIIEMVFLQQPDLSEDSQGRITLGPLECVETNTQRYVVTFTTSQSYIEVPGWRKGDLAFSFRTTGERAILLYHPPIRPNYPSFMVTLTSDYQLTFNFTLNTGHSRELVINSERRLNAGEWHKLWIDYNKYHVRFMINTEYEMIDLKPEEEFGPFEGSMFVGGAPIEMLKKSTVKQGLIGCFRGLVVNQEILDLYSYMSVHLSEIIKDCKPSCISNPCKNGATCKELWSTFQCLCSNQWAHSGIYCENNINEQGITFMTPNSNLVLPNEQTPIISAILKEHVLINFRTYEENVLIFYANDHLNNFVQLFLHNNGTEVTYMFNFGTSIQNVTVSNSKSFNNGGSNQVAVIRAENMTILHLNNFNRSVPFGIKLLDTYSNKPWMNPDQEVLAPQRPPVSPTMYFQMNLGGFDLYNLIQYRNDRKLNGFVGCIRGFKIGNNLLDLSKIAENELLQNEQLGIMADCKMKCDDAPCKNQGICIDNFRNQAHLCDCEFTSYYGDFCSEEKGADFSGESLLTRNFIIDEPISFIKVQMAFSSNDIREKYTILLLLLSDNNYYLIVALTPEGYLTFKENRYNVTYGAIVTAVNFYNSARHSVYYKRTDHHIELMVDRHQINISEIFEPELHSGAGNPVNQVQIGGLNTTDPRFAIYKGYSGCLSNIFLEVNDYVMKPLEEYMLFTKAGSEKVKVTNSYGVRSAQCNSNFDIEHKAQSQPTLNISQGIDKTWVVEPPNRESYEFYFTKQPPEENNMANMIVMGLSALLVIILLACAYEVYRSDKKFRKRLEIETDANILWSKENAAKLQEPPTILKNAVTATAAAAVHISPASSPDSLSGNIRHLLVETDNGNFLHLPKVTLNRPSLTESIKLLNLPIEEELTEDE